ncbi:BlaI/MecI/CopY family transcriptional regulator [Streptomyces sp. NPDC015220]|uniref:BlaI/MecI/CopY family transcriptional regulator n=1 Tax=Streptomyces sp. NPDC015220 TaxID=3364947 RepID=UPI0036F5FBEC
MTRVWKWNRPVTVREVLEDLQRERSIAYTTVMTVLDNLHHKGWVRREAEGRAYRYEAVSTRAAYAAALMNDAWSQSDNAAAALVAFFGMMSDEQRRALRDAVRIVEGTTEALVRTAPEGPAEDAAREAAEEAPQDADEVTGEVPDTATAADAFETGDQNPGSAAGGNER